MISFHAHDTSQNQENCDRSRCSVYLEKTFHHWILKSEGYLLGQTEYYCKAGLKIIFKQIKKKTKQTNPDSICRIINLHISIYRNKIKLSEHTWSSLKRSCFLLIQTLEHRDHVLLFFSDHHFQAL